MKNNIFKFNRTTVFPTVYFKPNHLLFAVCLLLSSFVPSHQTPTEPAAFNEAPNAFTPCEIKNTTFKIGEELTHKVYYNWNFVWMSAGESVAKISEKMEDYYKITIKGNTYESYDWFYRIRDHYETMVHKNSLRPTTGMRYIEEGKYRLYDKVDFDFKNSKATSYRGKSKDKAYGETFDVEGCMHDIVSMIYYFRNVDFKHLKQGSELPMQIFMDREAWNVRLRYEGRKSIRVKGKGNHYVYKLTTRVSAGELFDDNSSVAVYISADKNKVPLLVKLELAIGSIQVVLKDYKNLRYPLESAVPSENP